MKRRILSLALALVLVITLLPAAVQAADVTVTITGHTTGNLGNEIDNYMSANGISDYADIAGLTVSGGTINNVDRAFLSSSGMYGTLKTVDFSGTSIDYTGVSGFPADNPNELPQYAFGNWTALKSIKLPDSVTRIEAWAFSRCDSLETVYLPSNLTYIDYQVFYWSTMLKDFYTNSATPPEYISNSAFENVASDAAIHVPMGSESAWDNKDWTPNDNKLYNVFVENMAPVISHWEERTSETTAEINISTNEEGSSCYYAVVKDGEAAPGIDTSDTGTENGLTLHLTGLEPVAYDIYVKAKDLRGNVSDLVKIDLEAYVVPVDVDIDSHTTGNLKTEIDSALTSSGIPGRYEKIQNLKVSGEALDDNDWLAFYDDYYWKMAYATQSIDLSGTFSQSIPDEMFEYYNMTDISLPSGIESIGAYAFYECGSLADITLPSPTPPTVGEDAFYGIPSTAIAHVPAGSAAVYKAVYDGDTADGLWYGLTVDAPELVSAEINPHSVSFDLNDPQDVSTIITWNDASVVDTVYQSESLDEDMDYTINLDTLTIKQEYLLSLNPSEGDSVDFDISFDVGDNASLTVNIVNSLSITTGSISGTVTDGTGPVYGAVVSLTVTDSVYSDVTAADGSYTILNIPVGTDYTVTANKTGYISGSVSGVTVTAGATTSDVDITLTAIQQTYTVTFDSQGGSPVPDITNISSGSTISAPAAPTRSGYTFKGWYKESACTHAWNFSTDRVTGNITLYARWSANTGNNGGGSSGSGGSGSGVGTTVVVIQPEKKPHQPVIAGFSATPKVDENGHATVTILERSVADAIAKALSHAKAQGKTENGIGIALNIGLPDTAKSLGIVLPQATLKKLVDAGVRQLEINGVIVSLNLDLEALKEVQRQSTGDVTITLKPVQNLSEAAKRLIGTRPVYEMTITYVKDGKTVTISSLNNGSVTLSISYTPGKNEAVGYLFGVYVDGNGNASRIAGSTYDTSSRSVIFSTSHFSVYGVGYTPPSVKFTDIATHWAKESIDYMVGRELFSGTSGTTFSPNTSMSRGMLVTVLGRFAGADVSGYKTSSFTDVKADSYYLPYVEWAYKKGIISAVVGNQFTPDGAVTREEIAVILQNYAKATGYTLPVTREAITFADNSSISSFAKDAVKAMQQAGIMSGKNNGYFDPKAAVTRAEIAATLHRYIMLTIDPATAEV